MALVLLNPTAQPLGQFDATPALVASVKGGEVLNFGSVLISSQTFAADSADGYVYPGTSRPVLQLATATANATNMLCDDGLKFYGTLLGQVVGGTVGTVSIGGAQLGPATGTASGRLTAWDKSGLYGVTLDACDTNVSSGLTPTNTGLTVGAVLGANSSGLITPATVTNPIGNFVEFRSNGSLVNTPNRLVSALNSPSSTVGGVLPQNLYMAVFHFSAA